MTRYLVVRVLQAIVTVVILTIFVFFGMRLLPGDPVYMLLTAEQVQNITQEEVQYIRHKYGLDRPLAVQYLSWLGDAVHGDLGKSMRYEEKVTSLLGERLPITAYLGIIAFVISFIIGVLAGVISALRRGGWIDSIVTLLANLGITVPVFWLGIIMIYLFSYYLKWLPIMGYTSPFEDFWLSIRQAIMPVICLAVMPLASTARQTRSSVLEVIHQDYIRTAWAKGLSERRIIIGHTLKNALIPVLTLTGLGISSILGGSVLIETVYNIPGMGRLAVTSLFQKDYTTAQGIVLLLAIVIIFSNLLVDISYGWLDPRIRYR
jgi:peptide/nickel transport system permease protein